jgi:Protein of unknown function (DUF3102)
MSAPRESSRTGLYPSRFGDVVMRGATPVDCAAAPMVPQAQQAVLDEHADTIRAYAKRSIKDILEIGRRLAEVKKLLGYGNFLSWIEREFRWSEDTAERLIALHALQRRIPEVADVSLPISGLYLLASPSTPVETAKAVIAKAQDGEPVSVVEIKSTIAEAKAAKISARVRKPKLPSYIPAEKHELEAAKAGAKKSVKAVTPGDSALSDFTARVLDLLRRIAKHRPDRFAATAVSADDLAKLGKFLTGLAELLKADGAQ